jgi:hypothetical protein
VKKRAERSRDAKAPPRTIVGVNDSRLRSETAARERRVIKSTSAK